MPAAAIAIIPIGLLLLSALGGKKKKPKPKPRPKPDATLQTQPIPVDWPAPPSSSQKPATADELAALGAAMDGPAAKPPAPPEPSKPATTKKQWAQKLYDLATRLIHTGHASQLGTAGAPNADVKAAQAGMGGVKADGIYGPKTMARGKELLGVEFPARTQKPRTPAPAPAPTKPPAQQQKPAPAPAPPPKPKPQAQAPAPPKPPASKPQSAPHVEIGPAEIKRSPVQAANDLLAYVTQLKSANQTSKLGTAAQPSAVVKAAQQDMGGLTADGIYGPKTRERGKALTGKTFPAR